MVNPAMLQNIYVFNNDEKDCKKSNVPLLMGIFYLLFLLFYSIETPGKLSKRLWGKFYLKLNQI